ncbi:hypothetical protein H4S08_000616 [Coemansia sp. RSA 1365]|nr:hypothetical protein H4S08_000616 [Coemansia sp. RSA 1365]
MADRTARTVTSGQQANGTPYKYDIRVSGDLYANEQDNRASTRVSVKILGNEDGDVVVEQDDARSLASPTPSAEGDTRSPIVTHKRVSDGGVELRIRALPVRTRQPALRTIVGGGGNGARDSDVPLSPAANRIRAASSFSSAPSTRPMTRDSDYSRLRPLSSHQSFMEISPAFNNECTSDMENARTGGARTPQSLERSTSPMLVGGGGSGDSGLLSPTFDSRPRSSSMTVVEEKATQTTLRGFPDEFKNATLAQTTVTGGCSSDCEVSDTRASSPASTVLRGGGAQRMADEESVFKAFNGPPVAPPEHQACSDSECKRSQSQPRQHIRARRTTKDRIRERNEYRERVESLLTQYFPNEILQRYLNELRHRYRFMGSSGMTPSEITKLLDETTADTQLKEQLRASLEELANTPVGEGAQSDTEQTVASTPSQRHYLSIRDTELRGVLDRTSVSPAPKAPKLQTATSSHLIGGGVSMEALTPTTPGAAPSTMRSDRQSVAASVAAESARYAGVEDYDADNDDGSSVRTGSRLRTKSMPIPEQSDDEQLVERPPSQLQASPPSSTRSQPTTPQPERSSPVGTAPHSDGPRREAPRDSRASGAPDPGHWADNAKYRMRPPDMSRAFSILKSQPIFVRDMPSSDIKFKSPFSRMYTAPTPDVRPASGARRSAASAASKRSVFSERHPAESKVARAVSELEEVLRRTEANTVSSIENDFHDGSTRAPEDYCDSSVAGKESELEASRDSLVGGGASSRSTSVATRISAGGAKYDGMRPDSAEKLSASQSTIRTDILMKEGMQYGDIDEGDECASNASESAVSVEPASHNDSSVTLPVRVEDMPPELAAVLWRTGGLENNRIRRIQLPPAASVISRKSAPARSEFLNKSAALHGLAVSDAASEKASVRSAATTTAAAAGKSNRSLTELDIVMGRTGSSNSSRSSTTSEKVAVLRGGSGSSLVANDSENELASVMRRTTGYVPSVSNSSRSVMTPVSESRPESVASALKSVYPPDALRPTSVAASSYRSGQNRAGLKAQTPGHASPVSSRSAAYSPARNAAASPAVSAMGAAAAHAPSPLRRPAYQPSERMSPPPQQTAPADNERAQAAPSPPLYRLPTPVFGRFPSPPPHIKNRAQEQAQPSDDDEEAKGLQAQRPGYASGAEVGSQVQPESMRARAQSVSQEHSRAPSREYKEDPVVDRLDLETGSLASRRSRPRNASEFGSTSTLMNKQSRDNFELPKVIEEDVDSLASYSGSHLARTPSLRGGGAGIGGRRPVPAAEMAEPSTLRGGGRVHPAFDAAHRAQRDATCDAGSCGVCGGGVDKSDVVVRPQVMHASCLRCEACDCLLTTSTFRAINGHVYCEDDYRRFFDEKGGGSRAVSMRPGMSPKQFQAMNRAIMESFTSVDDFLQHMRQLRERNAKPGDPLVLPYNGDPSQVKRGGDLDVDRQTHYEREHVTSPSGTPWITERVVDKKTKTKVLEKRYPAASPGLPSTESRTPPNQSTLVGGGARAPPNASHMDALRTTNMSSASRPSTSLLNDMRAINGWDHPLCPVCTEIVYPADRVTHEGYGYHKACMRCHRCTQATPVASAIRIKGALYCKKHGTELLRRRSILMRKKSTMGRRSRHNRTRDAVPADRFIDPASVTEPPPPVPQMPLHVAAARPQMSQQTAQPRRVTTAMRNFLDAAAEQIESQSFAPTTPEPRRSKHSEPRKSSLLKQSSTAKNASAHRRPLPVPKVKPVQTKQLHQHMQQQRSPPSHMSSPPPSPGPASSRAASRSIFAGSRESLYDPNVVDALRQEAQRQINGSQLTIPPPSPTRSSAHDNDRASHNRSPPRHLLSPCGPSIADALGKYNGANNGRVSVSSQFDPFANSQDPLNQTTASPLHQPAATAFSPNAHMDNLERRFRNANFRPPWALKSQSTLQL